MRLQIPGNDDSGAMAALLTFHILGLYPVPSSTQLLIGSPLLSSYSIYNDLFGTTTRFQVQNFDNTSVTAIPPEGSRYLVESVLINGQVQTSRCWVDFNQVFATSADVVIVVTADASQAGSCGEGQNALPDSLSTGGF